MGTRFAAIGLTLLFVISTLSGCIGNEDSDVENTENYFDEYSELQLEIADLRVNNTLLKNGKDDLTQQKCSTARPD